MAKATKQWQFREAIRVNVHDAISIFLADRLDSAEAPHIKRLRYELSCAIANHLSENYRIQQFADIFEWKKTRIKQ